MARTYKRDSRGRFASGGSSTGGGGSKGKTLKRGRVQLAEARRKVRTAKSKLAAIDPADQTIKSSLSKRAQRGAVTKAEKHLAKVKRTAIIKTRRMTGTIGKPKGLQPGALKPRPQVAQVSVMPRSEAKPLRIADTMRETMRALAQADARRIREIEAITGQKVRAPRKPPAGTGATVRPPGRRSVSGTLNDNLRRLAQSDAQTAREMADLAKPKPKGALKGGKGGKRMKGGEGAPKALPPASAKPGRLTSRGVAPGRRRKVKGPS